MVAKMMKWRPWPPMVTRKYEVRLVVKRLEGWDLVREGTQMKDEKLTVEIRWKGPKVTLGSLRRTVKRNFTKEGQAVAESDVVSWDNEDFQNLCSLTSYKDSVFYPWEISFSVFSNGMKQGQKNKVPTVGTATVNLAEYASMAADQRDFELNIPLTLSSAPSEPIPSLCVFLSLLELRTTPEASDSVQSTAAANERDDISAIKAGLRKVKILTEYYVSTRKAKKACLEEDDGQGRISTTINDDSDSLHDFEEREFDDIKDNANTRKSFSYGSLAYANGLRGLSHNVAKLSSEDEDWVYYSHRKSDVGSTEIDDANGLLNETSLFPRRSILPWRKRKLSPKVKGEPLLKKDYGEEGGDDIDYDRRQLSSDEAHPLGTSKTEEESSLNQSGFSEFGNDNFAIGSWEEKEVISRDGNLKLKAKVFLASIDQRSEQADGESACTALVALIANWFHNNRNLMPLKSQFDALIREGSSEWRSLCENEIYKEKFPDKHFDLETVLQAKIRPLTVVPEKSFVGFFHFDGIDEERFDFFKDAMSFDNIWDEICRDVEAEYSRNGVDESRVYIVSWNDHFFVLKVEKDAYFIIDTLGERLYEGCNQAYILKFDHESMIHKMPVKEKKDEEAVERPVEEVADEIVGCGKETCKEYIKSFLAAIPVRELQEDIKKGLNLTTPFHQRLQIELHYTRIIEPEPENTYAKPNVEDL